MNKSKLLVALLLFLSIISPSCDSKPKPAPTDPAPTEQSTPEPTPAEQAPAGQDQTEQAPAEPTPADQTSSEQPPSEQAPTEQASEETGQTETAPAEEAPAEEQSQEDILLKAKLDYLKLLHRSMGNALEQIKMEKVSELAKEIHKVASEANADQEVGVSQPSEMAEEQPAESTSENNDAESSSSAETGGNQEESKTEEPAAEGEPKSDENASAEKENEKNEPSKFKIRIDVIPRNSSKKEGYFVNEEVSLKIKVANQSLKDGTGPLSLHYFILGKGTKNNDEFVLFDSGEESFELGKTQADRSFEYSPSTFTNKYGTYGGSSNYKYDAWFIAVLDDEGKVIEIKSNKQTLRDYDLIKSMEKNYRYNKSLQKLEGGKKYMYN